MRGRQLSSFHPVIARVYDRCNGEFATSSDHVSDMQSHDFGQLTNVCMCNVRHQTFQIYITLRWYQTLHYM